MRCQFQGFDDQLIFDDRKDYPPLPAEPSGFLSPPSPLKGMRSVSPSKVRSYLSHAISPIYIVHPHRVGNSLQLPCQQTRFDNPSLHHYILPFQGTAGKP